MIPSLRAKLAASHILPPLLLLPVLGLYLIYALEGFFTQTLLHQLTVQARLVQERIERQPEPLDSSERIEAFLSTLSKLTDARVVFFSRDSIILGSTRREDRARLGTVYHDAAIEEALEGKMSQGVGPGFTAETAFVVLPLALPGPSPAVLRVSYGLADVRAQFNQLQGLVLGGVGLTTGLALILSLALATTITRPLRELGDSASEIALGNYAARVPVRGRDEVAALAQQFNQMASRLQEAERARQRQLAAITHEVARPLTGLRAAIETLREGAAAEAEMRQVLLDGVAEELARLQRLIGTLQGLDKTARPLQLQRGEVSLERLLQATAKSFEPAAARLGLTLEVSTPPRLPRVRADEDRLIQVLTNLLDNACKFTPPGGQVSVQAGEDQDALWVAVSDTGVGIAPEELPHLFQQFYRGDESRPPEKKGMGLGLALCREIVTAHGGAIRVESRAPEPGTRVVFTLPKN